MTRSIWQGLSRYLAALALIGLCWAISIHADDGLSALLESHYQHSGGAASHRNVDFASQLNLDRDPAEILAEADLSFKAPSTYEITEQRPKYSGAVTSAYNRVHSVSTAQKCSLEEIRLLARAAEGEAVNLTEMGTPEDVGGGQKEGAPRQTRPLTVADLAAAVPSNRAHLPLVIAGREWRQGMRAVIALAKEPSTEDQLEAAAANETWVAYPDDSPRRSPFFAGDSRAAMALGDTYKWLLYGDDDTVFFPEAAMQLLASFDPELPYAITDNILFAHMTGFHPPGSPFKPAAWNFASPRGCPCTPTLLCAAESERPLYGVAARGCTDPPPPKAATYAIHGGAGAILSVGLMRRLNRTQFESCVLSLKSTGGDAFFTICLWRAGYAPTDPGYSVFNPEARIFDPFQWEWGNDSDGEARIMRALEDSKSGSCDHQCQLRLDMMVSAHVRSRWKGVPYASAQITKLTKAYRQWSRQRQQQPTADF
ncbi:hypothetical protein COCSUDRAFT_39407 [Coccomyxa subellipsoidea C-169]|uniref:Hexosyltransferase n=1 Tax=Coccomyxa subellipsoidea (strain C-169) TaxID=574566 RepID=I0Z6J8_COCSC|nr:hypothetical protein COCSUDRAFT_39407 [Coccomyxa subellipsoidea C-169]EIE26267.1 hypothetical protein COCSUDRAFT_39407 [Coccomyxa subellipsoidea C-169]|eukprot:XP_005650811.1 hypothetical protein COCSUDRAFT_39407 [Coccomyxa subellipsoidea C-169]